MTVLSRTLALALLPLLAACGDSNARYLVDAPVPAQQQRVRVSTVEMREVTLPAYAAASEILVQQADGALRPVRNAIWAEDPTRGVTLALARNLDAAASATVMAEPWTLERRPDVQVDVRIERMVAQNDGLYRLAGQYAIASPDLVIRESVGRFDISQPLADTDPASVARATGAALMTLSQQIAGRLR